MTSCEPYRTDAYSQDMRWRMIWQCEGLGLPVMEVARNLGVDKSTVCRTVNLFLTTGSVAKKLYPKDRAYRMLTTPAQLLILNLVVDKPGIRLHELQEELQHVLELEVDISTVCRFLHASGFTRQKLRLVALQRDHALRQMFQNDVAVYSSDMLIFLDETGADLRDTVRKYGYSIRGLPIKKQSLLVRGERTSAIAMMSCEGILDVHVTRGTTDGETFIDFTLNNILPILQPFNGTNPHSVLVMDNCSIHHVQEITAIIDEVGALLLFLPPYSPDFNSIELAFSKVKTVLKELETSMASTDLNTLMLAAFAAISKEDCRGWISQSGLYN